MEAQGMTTLEAARLFKLSVQRICQHCRADQLQSRLLDLGVIAHTDPITKLIDAGLTAALRDEPVVQANAEARQGLLKRNR
jgi:hypothetical protein